MIRFEKITHLYNYLVVEMSKASRKGLKTLLLKNNSHYSQLVKVFDFTTIQVNTFLKEYTYYVYDRFD